ncbi:MAG: transglycosylase SLT domain-containing protein [Terrimesophilobacter sp.]
MLPAYSFVVSAAIILVSVIAPDYSAYANVGVPSDAAATSPTQQFEHSGDYSALLVRDGYRVTMPPKPPKAPTAPAAGKPDPGTAQAIAYNLVAARGWDVSQYSCLVALWNRESHWNMYAMNPVSGAYGIPQALPGSKMASAGADWATNPATQITWGLGYIAARYGTPCGAWEHSEQHHWY